MKNAAIATVLRRIGQLLAYQGIAFKPAAYFRAAETVERYAKEITKLQKKELVQLPGIGEAIAEKILEYGKTGRIRHLQELQAEATGGAAILMDIDDLGPKRVRLLEETLNIRTRADLIAAAKKGKLRTLPGFTGILEKKILENALRAETRTQRFPLDEVEGDVRQVLKAIRAIPNVVKAEAAGSFRRRTETVGDIDILLAVRLAKGIDREIADAIRRLRIVERVTAAGTTRIAFDLCSGLRVDIRLVSPDEWGSALLYFTGSKEHNITLRRRAIERGMKLSEYGLFKGKKRIASRTEEEIYRALALPFIDPKERAAEV